MIKVPVGVGRVMIADFISELWVLLLRMKWWDTSWAYFYLWSIPVVVVTTSNPTFPATDVTLQHYFHACKYEFCTYINPTHLFFLSFLSDDTTPGLSFYFYFTFCFSLFISVYCFSNTFSDQVFRTKNYSMWNQDFWVCFRIDMFSNHGLLYLSQVEI